MRVEYYPEALNELKEAVRYYEQQEAGLGIRFRETYRMGLVRIKRDPQVWQKIYSGCRKLNVPRFPYGIVYAIEGNILWVVAVMHLSRKPFYWKDRLPEI